MATPPQRPPLRLFLDTGVLIDGFFNRWGACKAVLILATLRTQFRAIVADPVGEELARGVTSKGVRKPSSAFTRRMCPALFALARCLQFHVTSISQL